MALLIRLIMALFTRPEIGLFHPTLTGTLLQPAYQFFYLLIAAILFAVGMFLLFTGQFTILVIAAFSVLVLVKLAGQLHAHVVAGFIMKVP